MISVEVAGSRLCDAISRREALRVGALPLLGPLLAFCLPASSGRPGVEPQRARAKRCIVLFLLGLCPTQHSTWDPKPEMPEEIRGAYGPIATSVPGIQICELLPLTAARMDRILLLRGVSTVTTRIRRAAILCSPANLISR